MLSPEIDQALLDFLQPLVMFQQRSYRQDPIKAKMKYVCFYCVCRNILVCTYIISIFNSFSVTSLSLTSKKNLFLFYILGKETQVNIDASLAC